MRMTDLFREELERETAGTRRVLERVPDGRKDWKPHEKSMTLRRLAELVATLPSWITMMIKQDRSGNDKLQITALRSSRELVEGLDHYVAEAAPGAAYQR